MIWKTLSFLSKKKIIAYAFQWPKAKRFQNYGFIEMDLDNNGFI